MKSAKMQKLKGILEDYTIIKDYINRMDASIIPHKQIKGVKFDGVAAVFTLFEWILMSATVFIYLKMLYSAIYLLPYVITSNLVYVGISSFLPFVVWALSTTSDYMSFHAKKRFYFYLCCFHAFSICLQSFYHPLYKIAVLIIQHIRITPIFTSTMAMNFACEFILLGLIGIGSALIHITAKELVKPGLVSMISTFRFHHYVDFRPYKQYRYDLSYANEVENGKKVVIKDKDRFTGSLVDGGSGTGKTSLIGMNTANEDLNRKLANLKLIEEEAFLLAKEGKIKLKNANISSIYSEGFFNIKAFTDNKNDKLIKRLSLKYPNCGLTIMAPDNSLIDDMINLVEKKGVEKYYVVDPSLDEKTKKLKKNLIGFNPFRLISSWRKLTIEQLEDEVSAVANLIADVLITVSNSEGAKTDLFYDGINRAVTVNISTVMALGVPLVHNRFATFEDFSYCVNDFTLLAPYVDKLEEMYGKVGKIIVPQKHNARRMDPNNDFEPQKIKLGIANEAMSDIEEEFEDDSLSKSKNPFKVAISQIKAELIGDGASSMFEQARGLRNMINIFMGNPKLRRLYTMKDSLDFDEMMDKGYIVFVNTVLSEGQVTSKSFGLFFLLMYKRAMFRRSVESRTTCYQSFLTDELPKYNTLEWEDMVTLARKFGIMFTGVIQSLGQFSKNETTKFLEDVFVGVGTQVVFGRAGVKDMEYFSKLDGNVYKDLERNSVSSNSIIEDNANQNFGVMTERKAVVNREGSEIRNVDFKEFTVYTCNEGYTSPSKLAKGYFLDKTDAYKKAPKANCDWESIESFIIQNQVDIEEEMSNKTAASDMIEDYIDNLESDIMFTGVEYKEDTSPKSSNKKDNSEGTKSSDVSKLLKYL